LPVKAPEPRKSVSAVPSTSKPGTGFFSQLHLFKKTSPAPKVVEKKSDFSRKDLVGLLSSHAPEFKTCRDTVLRGNKRYVVHYSLDSALQKCGETLFRQYHPKYGAYIAMEPATGRVVSMFSYTREGEDSIGERLYCRSIFPAASVFKTVTAAGAIEKGHVSPESTFSLAGRRYTLYKFQLKPELASYQDITLADAYCMSINPVFGRIGLYVLGREGLAEYMRKFGFNRAVPFDLDNENPTADENLKDSLLVIAEAASGFNTVTRISPLFGALIASSVAENGVMPTPSLVDSICLDSCAVYRGVHEPLRNPIKESTAAALKEMMMRVAQKGTARHSFRYARNSKCFNDVEYGGKTGSVDEDTLGKIDWFVGFALHKSDPKQRLAVGVVTVHDEYWTVHSSYIAEELFKTFLRKMQKTEKDEVRILAAGDRRPEPKEVVVAHHGVDTAVKTPDAQETTGEADSDTTETEEDEESN
jgi:cell division protein FtsI/penicillin-binding protein 2